MCDKENDSKLHTVFFHHSGNSIAVSAYRCKGSAVTMSLPVQAAKAIQQFYQASVKAPEKTLML